MTGRPARFLVIGVDGSPNVRVAVLYRHSEHGACESPIDRKARPLLRFKATGSHCGTGNRLIAGGSRTIAAESGDKIAKSARET